MVVDCGLKNELGSMGHGFGDRTSEMQQPGSSLNSDVHTIIRETTQHAMRGESRKCNNDIISLPECREPLAASPSEIGVGDEAGLARCWWKGEGAAEQQ